MKPSEKEGLHDSSSAPPRAAPDDRSLVGGVFAEALGRYLDQVGPPETASAPATREARRLCGRWVALRRLQIGLGSAQVAEQAGVDPRALSLLELGLADATMADDAAWERLCHALAEGHGDTDWAAAIVETAIGRRDASAGLVAAVERLLE